MKPLPLKFVLGTLIVLGAIVAGILGIVHPHRVGRFDEVIAQIGVAGFPSEVSSAWNDPDSLVLQNKP
ncbi:MAG: hypothetical protein WC749_11025 [Dehalococcoidia bacterium]